MIKKVLSALVAISLILTCGTIAFADSDMSVTAVVDASTGNVVLSGYCDSTVSITVVPSDVTFENYLSEIDKCIFFAFAQPKDGQFEKSFFIPSSAPAGKYTVYISSSFGEASDTFMKTGTASDETLTSLNSASGADELKAVVEANADVLGVDTEHPQYENASGYAYEILCAFDNEYSSAVEFYTDYGKAFALATIVESEDAEGALKANSVYLDVNYTKDFASDKRLSDETKAELLKLIKECDWEEIMESASDISEGFSKEFSSLRAIAAVRMCDTRVQLQSVMEKDFSDDFPFVSENTKYAKLKNADKVYEEMIKSGADVKTVDAIEDLFDSAVSKRYKAENNESSGGGGGGGGGSFSYEEKPTVGISSSYGEDTNVKEEYPEENKDFEFTDVSKDYWGYSAINTLIEKKMINGYEDGSFRPEGLITRAEFARLMVNLYEASGKIASNDGEAFEDVDAYAWYYDAINKASGLGIIKGADGKFNPGEVITRQDAALILYRTLVLLGTPVEGETSFTDFDAISSYAKDAVSALAGSGFISGMGDGSFAPLSNLTRAQAAQLIANAI